KPVKLNARRLREQYLPSSTDQSESFYVRVTVDGKIAGHVFACRWMWGNLIICWITQLVVDKDHRQEGLATSLLRALGKNSDDIYGIMSSHPAACLAAAKAYGRTIEKVDLGFINETASKVLSTSPIPYIRDSKLCGTIFDALDASGMVSGVNTHFFVDHKEPLEALEVVKDQWEWPLGSLPEGHEYLLILAGKEWV
ncbi:hypothetical protein N7509_007766, partial [Penicillium cosmopolitanum]